MSNTEIFIVALANEKGAMTLTAGESASISPAKAPEKGGPPERGPMKKVIALAPEPIAAPTNETTREELLRRDAQMREQIAMLQNKVQELESAPPPKDDLREKNWWFEPQRREEIAWPLSFLYKRYVVSEEKMTPTTPTTPRIR